MGAILPTTKELLSIGSRDGVLAAFTGIAEGETCETGMSAVEYVDFVNATHGSTVGYTVSGGVVTFKIGGGSLVETTVLVLGFN